MNQPMTRNKPHSRCACRFLIAVLFSVFARSTIHGQAADAVASTQEVHGVVVNSVTNKPIARALVFSADQRYAMLTDQEGRFEFKLAVPIQTTENSGNSTYTGSSGSYSGRSALIMATLNLAARKPGYLGDDGRRQSFHAVTASDEITLQLTPEAIVAGKVTLSTTDLPAGVNIQFLRKVIEAGRARWQPANNVVTNSKGEFRITDLAAGDYKLMSREWVDRDPVADGPRLQHYGYPPVYYPGATDFASSGILHVEAGATVQADFSLTRQPYYPVKIEIANATRGVGLGVTVSTATGAGQGPPGFDLGYNNRVGRVEGELPNGTYSVEAMGYQPAGGSSATVTVTVSGGPATGPRMTLVPNQSISVAIKDERAAGSEALNSGDTGGGLLSFQGQPPPGKQRIANVYLESESQGQGGSLRTPKGPDDDSLVIENVAAGRYKVRAQPSNGYAAAITSGVTDLFTEPLVVGGSGTIAPIEVTIRNDYATLELVVHAEAVQGESMSATPASAYVYIIPLSNGPGQYQEIAAIDGKMTMPNFIPGTYHVLAFDQRQQLEYQNLEAMRAYENLGRVVTVAGGQTQQVEVTGIRTGKQ